MFFNNVPKTRHLKIGFWGNSEGIGRETYSLDPIPFSLGS